MQIIEQAIERQNADAFALGGAAAAQAVGAHIIQPEEKKLRV